MSIILESAEDFNWYCKKLDVDGKYNHRHIGTPSKYPCKVLSEWGDEPNGPYFYVHDFIYQQTITCECCGHKKLIWPEC